MSKREISSIMKQHMPLQPIVRGIDHLGITVPDMESATRYFVSAFGAEVLYDLLSPNEASLGGTDTEAAVGIAAGTVVRAIRLLKLHDGASLELFEYGASTQKASVIPSDFGLQHMAIYVDNIIAVAERVRQAGGQLMAGPVDLPEIEGGPGNQFWYTRAPWGMTIELITYPAPQPYEKTTHKRRWKPDAAAERKINADK